MEIATQWTLITVAALAVAYLFTHKKNSIWEGEHGRNNLSWMVLVVNVDFLHAGHLS